MAELKGSKTENNLLEAFAGESQANRKYLAFADKADAEGHKQVADTLYHYASGKALEDGAAHSDVLRAAMFWAKTRMRWRETDREGDAPPLDVTPTRLVVEVTVPNDK